MGGFPRCDNNVNYWLNVANDGTTLPSGIIHLELDPAISFVNSIVTPDSITGQNIYWSFDSLSYFSDTLINLTVLMPDFNSIGDTLTSTMETTVLDSLGSPTLSNTKVLEQLLVCAYDPNDKKVTPAGVGSEGFILPETPFLDYVIRFQNTGTDTALNVTLVDQLDLNLDWQSLQIMSSSDPVLVDVEQFGEVTFDFVNIMLPDSNVNEIGSHGYVSYRINLLPNLALGTTIENYASIYFDNNPAVITNSTLNTIDVCFDQEIAFVEDYSLDTVCINSSAIGLPVASPIGGSYSGAGVVAGEFDPSIAGVGTHSLYYSSTDSLGCYSIDSTNITVDACASLFQLPNETIKIYPNPTQDYLTFEFVPIDHQILIYDPIGRVIFTYSSSTTSKMTIPVSQLEKGILIISIKDKSGNSIFNDRVIVQ